MSKVIYVDKPEGITSFDVCYKLRKVFNTKAIGHTGTLDPLASGVMIVLVDKATKANQFLVGDDKEYVAEVMYGYQTDTLDKDGKIIKKEDFKVPDPKDLNAVIDSYIKTYDQEPPLTSAIKVKGKKLYEYQRQGLKVEIPKRKVTIYDLTLLEAKDDGFSFKVKVSSGTYIRSLIRDILDDLGLIGTLVSLRRISVGNIEVKDCDKLDAILEGRYHTHSLYDVLASRYEVYEFEDDKAIRNGKKIKINTPNDEVLIAKDKIALAIYRREDKDVFRSSRGLF